MLSEKRTASGGAELVWLDGSATIALGSDRRVRFGGLRQHLASRIAWWWEGDHQDLIDGETSRAEQPIGAESGCTITCGGKHLSRGANQKHTTAMIDVTEGDRGQGESTTAPRSSRLRGG